MANFFPANQKVIVALPTVLLHSFDQYVKSVGATRSEMVRHALREYMQNHDIPIVSPPATKPEEPVERFGVGDAPVVQPKPVSPEKPPRPPQTPTKQEPRRNPPTLYT